jgi:hypothetical protein
MSDISILDKAFIDHILATARRNLECDGKLWPVLFVRFNEGMPVPSLMDFPDTTEERQAYLAAVGSSMRREGKVVREALLLMEGWIVKVRSGAHDLALPPSQHPLRQEAITIMGRDASGTHTSSVVQTFQRNEKNKVIWSEALLASYNQAASQGCQPVGLLDCLFDISGDTE